MSPEDLLAMARVEAEPSAQVRAKVLWNLKSALAEGRLTPDLESTSQPLSIAKLTPLAKYLVVATLAFSGGVVVGKSNAPAPLDSKATSGRLPATLSPPAASAEPAPLSRDTEPRPPARDRSDTPATSESRNTAMKSGLVASKPPRFERLESSLRSAEEATVDPKEFAEVVHHLQRAQAQLRDARPAAAISILNEIDAGHSKAILDEERAAVRAHAACAAGRSEGAKDYAKSYLARHPSSIYGERIRQACGLEP